ncbi:hypothetical protein [Streptomyces sp. NPDC001970]
MHRDILAVTMVPSDALVRRFIADLRLRGLPKVDTAAGGRPEGGAAAKGRAPPPA